MKSHETFINVCSKIGETLDLVILIIPFSNTFLNLIPTFNVAITLAYIHNKRLRQIFEASAFSLSRNVNNPPGFSAFRRIWENFTNGPGDLGPIPARVIPKTLKIVLDATFLNTQHYKVKIKGKVDQSGEKE